MARPIRFWRRFMPRFGILWIFVSMLLVVSAAGWWKFHYDLYVEEVEVIRALKASAGNVVVRRTEQILPPSATEEDFDGPIPWNAPLLPPVERIYVDGPLPDDVRDAAARLPRLKSLRISPDLTIGTPSVASSSTFDFESHLGRALPELPAETLSIDSVHAPLPEGEEVDAEEAARVAGAVYEAWRDDARMPSRFLVISREKPLAGPFEEKLVVHVVEPERRYHFYRRDSFERAVLLSNGEEHDLFRYPGGDWGRETRHAEMDVREDDEVFRRFPADDFPYASPDFLGFLTATRALEAMPRFEFDRVAKIDDVRYRVEFKPFVAPLNEEDAQFNVIDPQVIEWGLILRSDLNWAPEESKIVQRIQQTDWGNPMDYERQTSQRFRREGDHVLLTERIMREGAGPQGAQTGNQLAHVVYAYELDPEYDERIFGPLSLDPEPWAPRRELPWLPWYRVTFLLACGLALASIFRSFASRRAAVEAASDGTALEKEEPPAEA